MEIAFFDRGPIDAKNLMLGGYWSAYWYNGHIYGSEIARGIDIFSLTPSEYLSQNEIDAAMMIRNEELNTQEQQKIVWPAAMPVARAYLDQLTRSKAHPAGARPRGEGRDRSRRQHPHRQGARRRRGARSARRGRAQLESDAAARIGRDAMRFKSLAATIKGRDGEAALRRFTIGRNRRDRKDRREEIFFSASSAVSAVPSDRGLERPGFQREGRRQLGLLVLAGDAMRHVVAEHDPVFVAVA